MRIYNLNELLCNYLNLNELEVIYITGIKDNSRLIVKGDLFVALKGFNFDGKNYIYESVLNGAVAVLTYSNINKSYYVFNKKYNIYIFYLFKLNFFLSEIFNRFYNYSSKNLLILGVTGTNGKTTVVNISAQWLMLLGYKTYILSTLGNGFYNKLNPSLNTTGSALETQINLKLCDDNKVDFVSIEVSSHALDQYRVNSLNFSAAVFTNLSIDHLDYHLNFKNYELSKWKLFYDFDIDNLIINVDDNIGFKWYKKLSKKIVIPVSLNYKKIFFDTKRWLFVTKIRFFGFLKKIYFVSSWGKGVLKIFLVGFYNIMNVLLSFVALLSLNFSFEKLLNFSKYLVLPKGRMEFFYKFNKPLVIVDYAHTPDALKTVLLESRKYCKSKLWCVFGCTGNRDRIKRPIMGKIAKKYADIIIITNDDLHFEDENIILNDIKLGIKDFNNVYIILNRILAVKFALSNSNVNDVVIITGKGHENFQIIFGHRIKYSDRNLVKQILGI